MQFRFGLALVIAFTACAAPLKTEPPQPICRNGVVEADEACDDGNGFDNDGCDNDCSLSFCGDGVLHELEGCDDGNEIDTDACVSDCRVARCGDGFIQAGVEECDDANSIAEDACLNDCLANACGDGIVNAAVEFCDDGNSVDEDGCTNACEPARCGDGFVQVGETCDDANAVETDACLSDCSAARCGDGHAQAGVEDCDDANSVDDDACSNACAAARCGDGVVQDGEACDDGGAVDEDACRSDCAFNSCGDGARNPAEEACDDGNAVNDDACSNDCQTPRCGDQIVQDGEACDDGNIETRDACTNACSIARCGDGILRLEGEECDDGNEVDGDGCSAACAIDRVAVDPNQSAAMASLLSGESQSATLDHVLVTYHNVSNLQEVGFFLQAEAAGPAMFVQVSAAQAGVRAGDIVRLRITRTFPYGGTRRGGAVADVVVLSRDEELAPWTHDISADADVLAERSARASHRVSARLRVDGAMRAAGGNYVSAQISTAGIADEAGFRVRLHRTLQAALYLEPGCVVQVTGVPLIHFQSEAQITPTRLSEVAIVDCPTTTPTALQANATTEVSLAFRRALQADTVAADGSDFAIQGLAISAAAVNAEGIVLTTAPQTEGEVYTLRLVGAVADLAGAAVAMGEFADFRGYRPPAQLRLNELNANAANGCDQLELRVISAGLLRGSIKERTAIVFRFPEVVVAADDLIVLHFDRGDARCTRPTREADQPGNETETKDQFAAADFAANYDTAWDFWAEDRGLTATDNVITVLLDDQIVDGVCVSDAEDGTAAGATETAANTLVAAQGWTAPDGTVPQGGFVDDSFNAAAAQDLNGEGTADSSMSIRRVHPQDRNHRGDWAFGASSFGAVN